jgi:hypothetical protein
MPAQSKAQQRFMGMVHAAQKGDMENPSPEVEKAADSMSDKDAKDFASTKHDGLPDKVKEFIVQEARGLKTIHKEYGDVVDDIQKQLELYKQSKGTPQEKQYVQKLKQLNDKKKELAAELDQKISGIYKDAELKVDEMNTSAAAGPYNTPFAFGKGEDEKTKGKKQADLTGYTVVKEAFIPNVGNIDDFKLKSLLLKNPKVKQILGNDEWKFLSDDKTDVIMVSGKPFNTITTDGKLEFELDLKAQKLVKPLGKARPKISSHYSNLNENIISEDIDTMYLVVALISQLALAGQLGLDKFADYERGLGPIDSIKKWWKDKKDDKAVKSIIAKIKSDPEMIAFFKLSQNQQKGKFRKLISTKLSGDEIQYLNRINKSDLQENRWRDIKNEEAPATTKVNKGIANINHQLAEIEKFLGWYGKLKAENGVNNGNFWKRTNNHIYTIKERLLNLERQVRKISE